MYIEIYYSLKKTGFKFLFTYTDTLIINKFFNQKIIIIKNIVIF